MDTTVFIINLTDRFQSVAMEYDSEDQDEIKCIIGHYLELWSEGDAEVSSEEDDTKLVYEFSLENSLKSPSYWTEEHHSQNIIDIVSPYLPFENTYVDSSIEEDSGTFEFYDFDIEESMEVFQDDYV